MINALSPLPAIYSSYCEIKRSPEHAQEQKQYLKRSLSRMWIFLTLNNAVTMGTYAFVRGDLPDSVLGNFLGNIIQLVLMAMWFLGLLTNLFTLTILDLALGQRRKLFSTIAYLVTIAVTLRLFFELKTISYIAMICNSLSVGLGPVGLLSQLVKHINPSKSHGTST